MSAPKTPIMYIQQGRTPGRIGRVRLSKTGRTISYRELVLESLGGRGYKANFIDLATNETYWVSGPRKDGQDTLYPGRVEIDEDVVEEYWRDVRGEPGRRDKEFRSTGVHGNHATR
ncbi:MAG: 1-deoxy-D-xylulose-5-phosphate synthase [Kofleriaceae bacterium]